MQPCFYNSRDPSCKTPFGALKAGETAQFTLRVCKSFAGSRPVMLVYPIDAPEKAVFVPMELCGADFIYTCYSCRFGWDVPALLGYHFVLEGEGTTVKRAEDGSAVTGGAGLAWQLTVYGAAARCPSVLREGVMYQIFPDRFFSSGTPKQNVPADRVLRGDWGGMPYWHPNEAGEVTNADYFGGDLRGITQKLGYLASLGVTVIYLNPVFEAHSNHRYNTADYKKIDPLLGDSNNFKELCAAAKERGIAVLLDGVFSHTGSDSVYFNKGKRYGAGGAYNEPGSPYSPWYRFTRFPDKYECWWNFPTLPNVEETEPSYIEFICGEEGVLSYWMEHGAAGFRLDVADELPDAFLEALHARVKKHNPNHAVLGEVWEDASNKKSYGVRRRYLLGGQMDSVMNYVWKDALLRYMRHGDGRQWYNAVMQVLENYPKPALQSLMNSLSTHDSIRAVTMLGGDEPDNNGREWQEAHHTLNLKQYLNGCQLFKLAGILQFGLPGIPCIYYGDEAGLYGYRDPFNRLCYPWGNEDLPMLRHFTALGSIRKQYPVFAEADFVPLVFGDALCAFVRTFEDVSLLFAVNRSAEPQKLPLPEGFADAKELLVCGGYTQGVLEALSGVVLLHR